MVLAAHRAQFLPLFHNCLFIDPMAGVDGNIRMTLPFVKFRHLTAHSASESSIERLDVSLGNDFYALLPSGV